MTQFPEGWVRCGCCAGLTWSYGGIVYRYASGHLALWPGGPEHPSYMRKLIKDRKAAA